MNDDLVQPNRGFGEHPHRDVEICTYIVEGALTHKDSMGTDETLTRGAVQFMTAGRGVYHSEHNLHPTQPLRFIQIWINTRQRGLKPNYGSFPGDDPSLRWNQWQHLVSDVIPSTSTSSSTTLASFAPPIQINQDANIYVTELEIGHTVDFQLAEGRAGYLLCMEGDISVQQGGGGSGSGDPSTAVESTLITNEFLQRHDAAEIYGPHHFTITAIDPTSSSSSTVEGEITPPSPSSSGARTAHVLFVEMANTGIGRTDL
jgi:quercetin 2,3-dioxygenase